MVEYPIGDLIAERVRAMGRAAFLQTLQARRRARAPTWPPYTATAATACARRWCSITDRTKPGRCSSRATSIGKPSSRGGVRWFHSGRDFRGPLAHHLGVIIEGMQAAKEAGAVVSFDLNYRAKLWNISGGEERAVSVLDRIVKNADVLVGNEEDLQKGLGIPGPEVAAKSQARPQRLLRDDRPGRLRSIRR